MLVTTVWILLTVLIGGGLLVWRFQEPKRIMSSGDSYFYMQRALVFTGVGGPEATTIATGLICADMNRANRASGSPVRCGGYNVSRISPRYVAIFTGRPGYPLFAAPFVALLGAWTGMLTATVILALAAVLLAFLAVHLASGSRVAGSVAGTALLALPSGHWMTRMLTEGGLMAGYLAVIIGALLAGRGRLRAGLAVAGVALAWLLAVKSAAGLAAALALTAAGAIGLLRPWFHGRGAAAPRPAMPWPATPWPRRATGPPTRLPASQHASAEMPPAAQPALPPPAQPALPPPAQPALPPARPALPPARPEVRPAVLLVLLGLATLTLWLAFAKLTHQPGLTVTIEDYATRHFRKPDVPRPYHWLIQKNRTYWPQQIHALLRAPLPPLSLAAAAVLLIARLRRAAVPFVVIGLSGLVMQVAHPVQGEWDRVTVALWLPVAAGAGVAVAWLAGCLRKALPLSPSRRGLGSTSP